MRTIEEAGGEDYSQQMIKDTNNSLKWIGILTK